MTWARSADSAQLPRLGDVLGADFRANAMAIDAEREGVRVIGFAGLPTLSRANSLAQYLFVNGRPVRDKLLFGAVRAAYADYLPRDRHPLAGAVRHARRARSRRQRASGQDRSALPRRRSGARADRARAQGGAGARRPARRLDRRRRHHRGVPPGCGAAARGATTGGALRRGRRALRLRAARARLCAKPRRRLSTSASRRRMRAVASFEPAADQIERAARRRARAGARDLYRGADRATGS